ncbi:MAG: protein kinase [Planctomycetes bacterium]|nr:protein kinase [Planctomycetota bacterium]
MSSNPSRATTAADLASCEDLLALYLEEHHEGRGDFEAFCARFPEQAEGLRALHARLLAIGELDLAPSAARAEANAPLQRVEEFELLRELGRGGMGIVYEARDRVLARRVAVKLLPAHRLALGDARQRFEREVAALSRLAHPHLVAIYRSGLAHEPPFLAMELVRGGVSLEQRLRALHRVPFAQRRVEHLLGEVRERRSTSAFAEATTDLEAPRSGSSGTQARDASYATCIARLLAETAEALEHAHQNGVLHRDVKPANLLIDERGAARLVDFGVARLADEAALTATGGFAGTPLYAAPEQISREHGALDGRTDVYALGVVLYEALVGAPPYELRDGADSREIFECVLREVPVEAHRRAPLVPWELSVIAAKALEKRAEHRYPSAAAFAADLRAFLAQRPIVARPPGLWRRSVQSARRHPSIAIPAATAAAALVLATLFLLGRDVLRWRALEREAQAYLAALPARQAELRASYDHLAAAHRRLDALDIAKYKRPLDESERAERARLGASGVTLRDAAQALLWQRLEELQRFAAVLDEEQRQQAQSALLEPGLEFARAAGSAELERDLQRLAGLAPETLATSSTLRPFTLAVTPAEASVHLFRYVEERELARESWLSERLLPVPCDRTGRVLEFPAEAAWTPGKSYAVDPADPAGPRTLYPLFAVAANRFALVDLPRALPVGSYLLWIRAEGYIDARLPLYLDARIEEHEPALRAQLDRVGDVPAGFARIEGAAFLSGGDRGRSFQTSPLELREIQPFYLARAELRFDEYLEVLRWKQERGGSVAKHLPRDWRNESEPAPWSIDAQTLAITPPELGALPVCSIRYEDALAWCTYATEREAERGSPWIYELPWAVSWELAARGADGRIFAWGSGFDWASCFGQHTDPAAPAPLLPRASGCCLGDESPYGILDLTGNLEEFVYRDDRLDPRTSPGVKGGGFLRSDPLSFRLPRFVTYLPEPSRGTGFRPALRRRDMPAQGRRGEAPRSLAFEPRHD